MISKYVLFISISTSALPAIFAMKSHFGVLWRYHYVIATPTTFTTCECHAALRSLLILLLRSLPLVLEKKSVYNFLLRSLRDSHVKKKQNFISALRSRRHDHEKY